MDQERVAQLARELGDAELAERLVAARAAAVGPVPHDVARRHLRAVTLAAATTAAGAASVTTASSAAAATGIGAAASAGGLAAGGSVVGAVGGLKIGVAAFATAIVTAGGLGLTGHLPAPVQRVVDEVAGRSAPGSEDGAGGAEDGAGGADRSEADAGGFEAGTDRRDGPPGDADHRTRRSERADEVARDDEATDAPAGTPPRGRDEVGVDGPGDVPAPPKDPAGRGDTTTGPPDGAGEGRRDTAGGPPPADGPSGETGTPLIGDDEAPGSSGEAPNRRDEAPSRPDDPGSGTPDGDAPGRSGSAPRAPVDGATPGGGNGASSSEARQGRERASGTPAAYRSDRHAPSAEDHHAEDAPPDG